jgi:hypothetical protein
LLATLTGLPPFLSDFLRYRAPDAEFAIGAVRYMLRPRQGSLQTWTGDGRRVLLAKVCQSKP